MNTPMSRNDTHFEALPGPVQEAINSYARYYAEHHKLGMSIRDDLIYIAHVALRWKPEAQPISDEVFTGGEFRIKLADQWYYRGNRSPSWFYIASRADGSCQGGISTKCSPVLWPLLNAVAERLASPVSEIAPSEREKLDAIYSTLRGVPEAMAAMVVPVVNEATMAYWCRQVSAALELAAPASATRRREG